MSEENYRDVPEPSENGFYLEQDRNQRMYTYHFCLGICLFALVYSLFDKIFSVLALDDAYKLMDAELNMEYFISDMKATLIFVLKFFISILSTWWLFRIMIGIWNRSRHYHLKYYHP